MSNNSNSKDTKLLNTLLYSILFSVSSLFYNYLGIFTIITSSTLLFSTSFLGFTLNREFIPYVKNTCTKLFSETNSDSDLNKSTQTNEDMDEVISRNTISKKGENTLELCLSSMLLSGSVLLYNYLGIFSPQTSCALLLSSSFLSFCSLPNSFTYLKENFFKKSYPLVIERETQTDEITKEDLRKALKDLTLQENGDDVYNHPIQTEADLMSRIEEID